MTQNKIPTPISIAPNVKNSKQGEGGGGSRLKGGVERKEWSSDTQNELAEKIGDATKVKLKNAKDALPIRIVQRGDTLGAIVGGLKRGGAIEGVGNIYNLKVEFRTGGETKTFKNMFAKDLPDIRIGQKIWVEGGKIRVADEMPGKVEKAKKEKPKVEIVEEKEKKEVSAQSELEKAMADLEAEMLNSNQDLEKLKELIAAVETAKNRNSQLAEIKKDPLAAADKIIAKLQKQKAEAERLKKAAELAKKIDAAKSAVKNLGELLNQNLPAESDSVEIQKLITELKAQNELAGTKMKGLEDSAPELKTKLVELQEPVRKKLGELKKALGVAKEKEAKAEKARKLKESLLANREKLKALEKVKVPGSNWLDLLKTALIQIGVQGGDFLDKAARGDINVADKSFGLHPGRSVEEGLFEGSTINSVSGRLGTSGVAAIEINKSLLPVDTTRQFEFSPDYLNSTGVAKRVVVRFWNGRERSTFWHLSDQVKNSSDVAMVARVKFQNQNVDNFIQILENGRVKDAKGKIIENKKLKNILRPEDKAEIKRHLPDFLSQ